MSSNSLKDTYSSIGEFRCVVSGTPGARPIVSVPGFGHDAHWYKPYTDALCSELDALDSPHEIFTLRMRRYNEWVGWPHSIRGWTRIIDDFVGAAELHEQNNGLEPIIIGHSMGAAAAWEHGLAHGSPVGLVAPLVPTNYSIPGYVVRGARTNWDLMRGKGGPAGKEYARRIRLAYLKRFIASPLNRILLIENAIKYAFPDGITDCPTFIVRAGDDGLFKNVPAQQELPARFSDATVVDYENGRHDLPMIDPEWLAERLAPWIVEQEREQEKRMQEKVLRAA